MTLVLEYMSQSVSSPAGTRFRVLGIPRIDLDRAMRSVDPGAKRQLQGMYEMIVLAVIE